MLTIYTNHPVECLFCKHSAIEFDFVEEEYLNELERLKRLEKLDWLKRQPNFLFFPKAKWNKF